jgi:putative transposase
LTVSRSSLYYKPVGESLVNLHLMQVMDKLFSEDPTLRVLGMQDELAELGLDYNVKRLRRLADLKQFGERNPNGAVKAGY